ncbi:MAG: hypothetical protein SGILL_003510 [Bacillariaceae sp.]
MSRRYTKKVDPYDDEVEGTEGSPQFKSKASENVPPVEAEDFNRQYDLTPVAAKGSKRKGRSKPKDKRSSRQSTGPRSYPVDPWETASPDAPQNTSHNEIFFPSSFSDDDVSVERYTDECASSSGDGRHNDHDDISMEHQDSDIIVTQRSTFLGPSDIHPRMEEREDDVAQLRLLAGKLNADWGAQDFMAPALARRIRDFQFAQEKRRKKYGDEKPWGILGLYDHLASIR